MSLLGTPGRFEKVSLFINATDLPKLHTFNMTDPFAVVYFHNKTSNSLEKIGTTEVIRDTLTPAWTTVLQVDYMFECVQSMVVRIYHQVSNKATTNESQHEIIGEFTFELAQLMRAPSQILNGSLLKGGRDGNGTVTVRGEPEVNSRDLFVVTFSGNKLANKDGFFGTSDPFIIISRMNEDGNYSAAWKSTRIDNSLNPRWAEVKIPVVHLCNGDHDRPLLIEIFDWDSNGKHQTMGQVKTSLCGLLSANGAPFDVIEEAVKAKKKNYVNSGTLIAANPHVEHHPTFTEFIAGGCELSVVVAIDYTGSNGDPSVPGTLHYIDRNNLARRNSYQDAIYCVGNVIEQYDSDKKYPVLGFGGRLKAADGTFAAVSHCFNVAADGQEVDGVAGIDAAYQQSIYNVMLSGPTLFAPLINTTANIVASEGCRQDRQKYTVLSIITDGTINDMEDTKRAIIAASKLPMSIIIIGVGSADFKDMNALDSDKGLLKSGSLTADRDIVQFVVFNEAVQQGISALSAQVLNEVPNQVLQYMEQHGIHPGARR